MTREEIVAELIDLLRRSGCTRLEIVRYGNHIGYCVLRGGRAEETPASTIAVPAHAQLDALVADAYRAFVEAVDSEPV